MGCKEGTDALVLSRIAFSKLNCRLADDLDQRNDNFKVLFICLAFIVSGHFKVRERLRLDWHELVNMLVNLEKPRL
jgi:hypothetical protein